jgi:O-antigen/teichoic acid export membrane protein
MTIYLSPSDYGITVTFTAFTSILAVFVHLSLSAAVNVNYFKISREDIKTYIANVILIVTFLAVIMCVFVYLFRDILSRKLEIPFIWLFIGVLFVFMQFFSLVNLGLWQTEQRSKPFAVYQIGQMFFSIALVLTLVVGFDMGWEGKLIAQTFTAIGFSLIAIWFLYQRNYLNFKVEKKYILDALKFGAPLIPHALSSWFKFGVDRVLLTTLISSSATGLYAVGFQFGFIVGIVGLAFNQAFSPYLYKKLKNISYKDKKKLVQWTYLYFVGILLLASLVSFIMPYIVKYFLDARYLLAIEYIPWIAFGYAFQGMYLMVVNYIFFTKKTYVLSLLTFSTGVTHMLLSYLLIKEYGAIGAAQATTLSFLITFVLVWVWSAKVYPMPWLFPNDTTKETL